MPSKYSDLNSLLDEDHEASSYFESLPDYIKQSISSRSQNINSFDSLRDYAQNLSRDDE